MSRSIETLITNLKAVAHEEIMFRKASDTSDKWQDEATPENVLLLIAEIERIALAAKKAEPVSFTYTGDGGYYGYAFVDTNEAEIHIKDDQKLYLIPPLSQTNHSELSDSVNEFLKALDDYKEQLVPINRNSALVNDLRKALLNSMEIPDYKSALLGLLTSRISKDHLGFFTLAGINKNNLVRAVEVSEATINFENVPQVNIGECLIPNGWLITQDWIKCSDRMPEDDDFVLVYPLPDFGVDLHVGQYIKFHKKGPGWFAQVSEQNYGVEFYPITVTHWMPLPTAPEKENG